MGCKKLCDKCKIDALYIILESKLKSNNTKV